MKRAIVFGLVISLFGCGPAAQSQRPADPVHNDLEKAVAALRNIKPDQLTPAQQDAVSKKIDGAWKTIELSGNDGVFRLKKEISDMERKGEKDDFFKLNVSRFLWKVGRLDRVQDIVEIWNSTSLNYHYHYVFHTAFEAAASHDERALPILRAVLKDDKGIVQTPHMPIKFPATHEFIWGVYGPKGLPVLQESMKTSKDPFEISAAIHLLYDAHFLGALPTVREFAKNENFLIREFAVYGLGHFGHPQDFNLLISGLRSKDGKDVTCHGLALATYGDLRGVPDLIPLLKSKDPSIRGISIFALGVLLAPASLEALQNHAGKTQVNREAQSCKRIVEKALKEMGLTWNEYAGKSLDEKKKHLETIRSRKWSFEPGEKRLSREEFLKLAQEWKQMSRLHDWVRAKHIVAAATVEDMNLLLEVKGALLLRLSDECLYETRRVDESIAYLGRSRYRKDPGVMDKVEGR